MKKKRSKSSKKWLKKHFNDIYVQNSHKNQLRSRAWFKLDEINKMTNLLYNKKCVVDLGAAPGGWSQYVSHQFLNKKNSEIIACDRINMKKIDKVIFMQGDLTNHLFLKQFLNYVCNKKVDLLISDMAPNITGISSIDIPNSIFLAELALKITKLILIKEGLFLVKIFQGTGVNQYLNLMREHFFHVKICKPKSSSACSREFFIIAGNKKK